MRSKVLSKLIFASCKINGVVETHLCKLCVILQSCGLLGVCPHRSAIFDVVKIKIHSSCEIEDCVETHLCKLCVMLRSRVLRVVCPH